MQEAGLIEQPRDANAKLRSHVPDLLSHPQEPVEDWRSQSRQGLALDLPARGGEPRDREPEGGGKPARAPACVLAPYSLRVDATQNGSTLSCVNVKEEGANLIGNEMGLGEMERQPSPPTRVEKQTHLRIVLLKEITDWNEIARFNAG